MLLQFLVSNYGSFKDEIILDMRPAKSKTMKEHLIIDTEGKRTEVLPFVTIYGANASGKTNLINAIDFMQKLILQGTRAEKNINVIPFKLDPEHESKPSRFEIIFKHKGKLFTYGFVVSRKMVHEEWLFAYFTNKESMIFERITKDNKAEVRAGSRLVAEAEDPDFIKFIAKGTRPNQLFLTEAMDKNIEIVKEIVHWFREHLHIIRPHSQYTLLAIRAYKEHDFMDYLSKFLHIADTGINAIKCESEEFNITKHLSELPEELRNQITEDLNRERTKQILLQTPKTTATIIKDDLEKGSPVKYLQLKTEHLRSDGSQVLFETSAESDGTRRLLDLAPMLLDIWERDRVFIIDELDRSLHTYISRLFIQTCIAGVAEKKAKGQFVMTTHDTNLLDRSILRRDEILFMEKDQAGASHLTCLAEYKVTEGLNYENGYLNGRFGAIPFIGNIQDLLR
ncbi:MAG: ATP/GTP-binding protein [Clostridiales bacterium]|nr:ATP/GTP-binding protein [Clostridiales bacterium]